MKSFLKALAMASVLACMCYDVPAQSSPERVEPPFWWIGMKNQELQLLVYAKDVSQTTPVMDYPGVSIARVTQVASPNYLFIYLTVSPDAKAGTAQIRFLRNKKVAYAYAYQFRQREGGSASRKGFNSSDVIYLITPDRFANGDQSNDNIPSLKEGVNRSNPDGRHGGDLKGVMDHLDYFKGLGVTALWLNPVQENNQPKYSYHGYSITDFYKVDERFGTNEDYRRLSAAARKDGIKIIMDVIPNHCGSEHWWMKDLPTSDWVNFQGKPSYTNHRRTAIQDIHGSHDDYVNMVDGWFVDTMPDLNQRNPMFSDYLIQNAIWWTEYADLGGLRVDTYPYPDPAFSAEFTRRIMEEYPNYNIVGEEMSFNPAIVSYWQRGKTNHDGYRSYLPSLMDFPLHGAVIEGLKEQESWFQGLIKPYEMLANDFLYAHPEDLVIFSDNHDVARFYSQIGEDLDLYKMGMTYFLTTRGIPQIFYGTEIIMTSPIERNDGLIRSDFPGGWPGDATNGFTGEGTTEKQAEAQRFVKRLLTWRKGADVIHNGRLMHFAPQNGMYVYFRYNESRKVMVILNKNRENQSLGTSRFREMLEGVKGGVDVIQDKQVSVGESISVPARSAMIIELQ
jgi:neopullulanase